MIGDSLSSSYLAIALKRTGFDAIVDPGAGRRRWSMLAIDGERATLQPAGDLLGPRRAATRRTACGPNSGRASGSAAIGPAGERLVRYAAVANDGRLAGRTGAGAVMGVEAAESDRDPGRRACRGSPIRAGVARWPARWRNGSLGPATAKYRELGTAANLAFFDRMGVLPTRNFRSGASTARRGLRARRCCSTTTPTATPAPPAPSAASTTTGRATAARRSRRGSNTKRSSRSARSAASTIRTPSCAPPPAATRSASTPSRPARRSPGRWNAAERGVDLGGPADDSPRFGDGAARAADDRRDRRPARHRRSAGRGHRARRGARSLARAATRGRCTSKGWSCPATIRASWRPWRSAWPSRRAAPATTARPPTRSIFPDRLDPTPTCAARAPAAADAEDRAAVLDSLTLCKFLRHAFDDLYAENAELLTRDHGRAVRRRRSGADRRADHDRQKAVQRAAGLDARPRHVAAAPARRRSRRAFPHRPGLAGPRGRRLLRRRGLGCGRPHPAARLAALGLAAVLPDEMVGES